MNEQWAAYQDSKAFADRVATLYGAGEDVLALQKARYGKRVGCASSPRRDARKSAATTPTTTTAACWRRRSIWTRLPA